MDIAEFINAIVSFAQNNTVVAIVIALGLLLFVYRKPKLFFGILFFGLILAAVLYVIANMAGSGSEYKKKLIEEEEKVSGITDQWRGVAG